MVTITTEGIDEAMAEFRELPPRLQRATVRSLNRAIGSASTFMSRAIAKNMAMKVGDVKKAFTLQQATTDRLNASLNASSYTRLPLIQFNASGPEPSRGRGRGVSYSLQGGRKTIPNAFIATMQSGHRGVFVRVGKSRLPVRELYGPSLGHVFDVYRVEGQQKAEDSFETNFAHEIEFATPAPASDDGAE